MPAQAIDRRQFARTLAAGVAALTCADWASGVERAGFKPRYILSSCMYGFAPLDQILPEVAKTGAASIDVWPKIHGNQREQLDEMGEQAFGELLERQHVSLGCLTQYPLGPFKLQNEMRLARRLGCQTIVTGAEGPHGLQGSELKSAVSTFVERMKPHLAVAEETGVTIAIENHANSLVESPDSIRWLAELSSSKHLAVALAPYHLPQDEKLLAELIRTLGNRMAMFYAWQHGMGCMTKLPKEQELLQLPGRGSLDFAPLLAALNDVDYRGWTSIFMHPFPRGIPILDTTEAVTAEINRARGYLERLLEKQSR
jgi:sugar phosphate isomerase/epimerase